MKHILFIALLGIVYGGCREKVKSVISKGADSSIYVQNDSGWKPKDSVIYWSKNTPDYEWAVPARYFYISYSTHTVNGDLSYGDIWFSFDEMPSKNQIDSMVYMMLPYKKNCYQRIIVDFIYEFKDSSDYQHFNKGYKSSPNYPTHKTCIKPQSEINWYLDTPVIKTLKE